MRLSTLLTLTVLASHIALAQETRTAEIESARDQKAARLSPDLPSKLERNLIRFKDDRILERWQAGAFGFTPRIGGLPNGSGLAFGTHYTRAMEKVSVDAGATFSTNSWTRFEAGVSSALDKLLMFDFRGVRRDYQTLSSPDVKYHLKDSTVDALLGFRINKYLRAGGSAGFETASMRNNETAATVDGDAARTGVFAQFDTRDKAAGPRSGRSLMARFDNYSALANSPYSFRQLELEAQQYIPFLNQRRVIALRSRTVQTFTSNGNRVPLFHQSVLGGSDDLRGYRPYRFQGDNLFVMNAEYRWEVFSGLDMAVFGDAGQVSPDRWDVSKLEKSAGFGFRFNAKNVTFLRIDTGFSSDGVHIFVRFNGIFRDRRLNSSSAAHLL